MTRASACRPPSSDLITRELFLPQKPLLTTRAPRLLIFSVNVSSVGKGGSGLVSITATDAALRSSDRPGRIAIGQVLHFVQPQMIGAALPGQKCPTWVSRRLTASV